MGQISVKNNVYQAVQQGLKNPELSPAERQALVRSAVMADAIIDPREDQLLDALENKVDITLTSAGQKPLKVAASVVSFVDDTELADAPLKPREPAPELAQVLSGKESMNSGHEGPAVAKVAELLKKAGYNVDPATTHYDSIKPTIAEFQLKRGLLKANSPHLGRLGPQTLKALQQVSELGDYNAEKGQALATRARTQTRGRTYSTRRCYEYVANAVSAKVGNFLYGGHAYMAANQLARNANFKEVKVSRADLPNLPAGAIVVWGKGNSKSGHISIADGKGNEISDFIGRQMTSHYGGAAPRVFLPQ